MASITLKVRSVSIDPRTNHTNVIFDDVVSSDYDAFANTMQGAEIINFTSITGTLKIPATKMSGSIASEDTVTISIGA